MKNDQHLTLFKAVHFLQQAMDLLQVSAPQRILIRSEEYFEHLHKLQDELAPYTDSDEEDEE